MIKTTVTRSRFATLFGIATYSFHAENELVGTRGLVVARTNREANQLVRAKLRQVTLAAKVGGAS